MPNFIEFTSWHNERTLGNPVHDGNLPKKFREIDGVRLNGEPVDFVDETVPERLHRYLIESPSLQRQRIANDCVAFVALMNSVEMRGGHNPFSDFDQASEVDLSSTLPIVLAQGFHGGLVIPRHIVQPAHLASGDYGSLHKLGDTGPLCMSSVSDAMGIMACNLAFPVTGLS